LKLTNKLGLPEAIVKAVQNDPYDSGDSDYTATGLLKPPRMAQLMKDNSIVEDVSDRLFSLQGQVMHYILERAAAELLTSGYLVEERLYGTYDGKTVSAQVDIFDKKTSTLCDYKYTSVYSAINGLKEDHRLQVSLQADLLRKNGYKVDKAQIILLLRDWSPGRKNNSYPESPIVVQEVPLMTSKEVEAWVSERIKAHEAAKVSLPLCSPEERWATPTFAVMKDVNSDKAHRVFDTLAEAEAFVAAKAPKEVIVKRDGRSRRCELYCPARFVCEQGKKFSQPEVDENGWKKVK